MLPSYSCTHIYSSCISVLHFAESQRQYGISTFYIAHIHENTREKIDRKNVKNIGVLMRL